MAVPVRAQAAVPAPDARAPVETSYREFAPPADLAVPLTCIWTGEPGVPRVLRVVPDGSVDVVWDGDALSVTRAAPHPLHLAIGSRLVVGVRIRPGLAGTILGTDISDLPDVVELGDLWSRRAVDRLGHEVGSQPLDRRGEILGRALVATAPLDDAALDLAAARALARGTGAVSSIAADLGASERHLRRRFRAATGLSLGAHRRIVRFHRFLRHADHAAEQGRGLRELAALSGYSDQAHLTRECRALAGSTPAALLRLRASDVHSRAAGGKDARTTGHLPPCAVCV